MTYTSVNGSSRHSGVKPVIGQPIEQAGYPMRHAVTWRIVEAFEPLEIAGWLIPDPNERERVLYANVDIHVDHAFAHGEVWSTADRSAVAVWFPRDGAPLPEIVNYDKRLALACGPYVGRFRTLDDMFDRRHPIDPHHHLAFLAVSPYRRREGLASALLDHYHRRLDRAGIPAYLEARSPRSRALYAHHRYTDLGSPIDVPGGPRVWPMWRAPRPAPLTWR
jgi:GNAT superfamily N-acetyltransferase